jgi:hypothetical protein
MTANFLSRSRPFPFADLSVVQVKPTYEQVSLVKDGCHAFRYIPRDAIAHAVGIIFARANQPRTQVLAALTIEMKSFTRDAAPLSYWNAQAAALLDYCNDNAIKAGV